MIPRRDDEVARWLKAKRNQFPKYSMQWYAVDIVLDEWRLRADVGAPLDTIERCADHMEPIGDGRNCIACDGGVF